MKARDEDASGRRSRRFAADVIREISFNTDFSVRTSSGIVPMNRMVSSRPFMENLIKLALFSGNMHSFSDFKDEKKPWLAVPVSLLGIFYIYALRKACPVDDEGYGDQRALAGMVMEIEGVFGPIPIDPMLMLEICSPTSGPAPAAEPQVSGPENYYG